MSAHMSIAEYKKLMAKGNKSGKTRSGKQRKKQGESPGEIAMALHLRAQRIDFKTQFKFCDHRKWKSDFLIIGTRILVEVEGGTWTGGRHTRGKGFERDCEKYNWATANGWSVMRFTTDQVVRGEAVKVVMGLLGVRQ